MSDALFDPKNMLRRCQRFVSGIAPELQFQLETKKAGTYPTQQKENGSALSLLAHKKARNKTKFAQTRVFGSQRQSRDKSFLGVSPFQSTCCLFQRLTKQSLFTIGNKIFLEYFRVARYPLLISLNSHLKFNWRIICFTFDVINEK